MIPDLDERLKRIIEGSMHQGRAPAANPDEGMGLEDIRRLGQGYSESGGEDLPPGTRVNFAEPDLEVAAPPPSRLPLQPAPQPKVVDLTKQPPGDIEAAYARAADREAQQRMAMERGGRELVAGLTRTQAQPVIQRPVDAVMQLYARRKERDALHAQNEAGRLGGAKFNFEQQEAARKAAEGKAKDERDFGYRQEHDAASLAQQKENAEATRALAGASMANTQKDRAAGDLSSLRKEFNALPDVKAFTEVDSSYRKIESAAVNDSPAGDLALITGFMKIIDPGSSVKEGEFANAENAGGVPDKIRARYNAIVNGERLAPSQRADFLKQAKALHDVHQQRYDAQAQRYRTLAERQGAAPDDVVAGPTLAPEDQAAMDWAKANPKDPRAAEILHRLGAK